MSNLKVSIFTLISVFIVYIMMILLVISNKQSDAEETSHQQSFEYTSDFMLEAPNHMPANTYEGYIKVWGDKETDRAVYIKENYKPEISLPINANVMMGDIQATVTYIDSNGFGISIDVLAAHGMSGTIVTYQGVPVGFVSKAEGAYQIYCVFL